MQLYEEDIESVVKETLVYMLGCKYEEINRTTHLSNDLRTDSLDELEIHMALEEEFDISIHEKDAEHIKYVYEIYDYIRDILVKEGHSVIPKPEGELVVKLLNDGGYECLSNINFPVWVVSTEPDISGQVTVYIEEVADIVGFDDTQFDIDGYDKRFPFFFTESEYEIAKPKTPEECGAIPEKHSENTFTVDGKEYKTPEEWVIASSGDTDIGELVSEMRPDSQHLDLLNVPTTSTLESEEAFESRVVTERVNNLFQAMREKSSQGEYIPVEWINELQRKYKCM